MKIVAYALVAGGVAALVVPADRPGLGWLVAGLVGIAAVLAGTRRGRWSPARTGAAVATVLLLGAGTVRAAHWLFWLCLLTALPCASFAVAGGGGTWGRLVRRAGLLLWHVPDGVGRGARAVTSARSGTGRLVAGTAAGVALAAVFAALFAAANPVFADLLRAGMPHPTFGGVTVFLVAVCLVLSAAYLRAAPPDLEDEPGAHRRRLGRAEWVAPLALVDLVFAVFVWTEGEVLFGGYRFVLGRGGPTFADYAREGFWELGLVTLLSLGIVAVVAYRVSRTGRTDRILVRALGGTLGVLTLVVVASALFRMATYVSAYGYTRVRLLGAGAELALGVVVLLVLVAGVRLRGRWLPGATATVAVCAVLGLVAVNPDAVVARTVIDRYRFDGHLDGNTLMGLSSDAIPALDTLPDPWRSCILRAYQPPSTVDDWRAWNYGRSSGWSAWHRQPLLYNVPSCWGIVETRDG